MGISIDLQPVPRFDISLIRYLNINFFRIRDALLSQPNIQSGSASFTMTAQNAVVLSITFATPFLVTPIIVAITNNPGNSVSAEVTSVSLTGCVLRLFQTGGANLTGTYQVNWVAMENTQ